MTLIELMIVIVIVAILASIGIPSYRGYLIRTQRTEAKTALLRIHAAEEKYYLQNNAYFYDLDSVGMSKKTENGLYDIAITLRGPDAGQGYTITATPAEKSSQKKDTKCQSFSLDDQGRRDSSPEDTQTCWR